MLALYYIKQSVMDAPDRSLIAVSENRDQLEQEIDRLCKLSANNILRMQEYEISRNYYIQTVKRSLKGFLEGNRSALIEQKQDDTMNWHDANNQPYHCGLRKQLESTLINNILENKWHFFLPGENRWKQFINEALLRPTEKVPVLPPYPKEPVLGMTYVKEKFFIEEVVCLK